MIVKVDVADSVEQALVSDLQNDLQSFTFHNQEVCLDVIPLCWGCHVVNNGHYDHVDNDNGHHRIKVTVSKVVGKKDKDKESKTKRERDHFICRSCRYPPLSGCGEAMPGTAERSWRTQERAPGRVWTCAQCLKECGEKRETAENPAKTKRITCSVCRDALPFGKFSVAW